MRLVDQGSQVYTVREQNLLIVEIRISGYRSDIDIKK